MRRLFARLSLAGAFLVTTTGLALAQAPARTINSSASSPQLKKLNVPASAARSIATQMSLRYHDVPGISIQPDVQNQQVVVMAPANQLGRIASEVRSLVQQAVQPASATQNGPLQIQLMQITWREFEDSLNQIAPSGTPVTTSRNGERASFQLTSAPLGGTTVEVDRRGNSVTVIAPEPAIPGWQKMIKAIDGRINQPGDVMELVRLVNAEPAPIQRAIRLLRELEQNDQEGFAAAQLPAGRQGGRSPFKNAVFQAPAAQDGGEDNAAGDDAGGEAGPQGVAGDTELQFIPELGMIIIKGAKKDVERVRQIIQEIEEQSELTRPEVEVKRLDHADSNAVAALLEQLYDDVLSTRQGEVSITALDNPNALLLIGRKEAIGSVLDLIGKIDLPIDDDDRLRVYRLQHASAVDAEETIRGFFSEQPGVSDDVRPGLGTRVRVLADYRTNSLIVSASPRDLEEVTRLINELDVQSIPSTSEIRTFPLNNALAEELAETLTDVIATAEGDTVTTPSTTLSIVRLGSEGSEQLDSGILAGAVITADANSNSIVVKADSSSMPLIAELIRQLDLAPGIDSFVKVFTLENSDAAQLTTALQSLFGDDAGTGGTSVGAANLTGLVTSTASESALTPLRFSPEVRTNSIIVSGSAEDLEVVESILLRLDSEGFAERITEVIWLRHQAATNLATAVQNYVQLRSQSQQQIPQIQQGGLSVYDLPDRDLIVVAEERTNSLILSVAPRLYEEVRRLIDRLDRRPPMIMVKTVIAEVRLDDFFEIGGELGLQDSLLFDRDVTTGALTPPPYGDNGFNFNETNLPNVNPFSPNNVAARGVTAFGVGTSNPTTGVGGFVINAASESVNILFRTLQTAGRLQIISRPMVTTADNTEALVQVGQLVSRPTGVVVNQATTTISVEDIDTGLILRIFPRVGSDGSIYMQIEAERSDINNTAPGQVIGSFEGVPVTVQPIDITRANSVLTAYSGQTVVFGGLIQKTRENITRRLPYVSNIPIIGNFFKYDREEESRSELLVVMTPTLINGEEDLEYVKQVESSRMSWCLADVVEAHGDVGLSHGYGLWGPAIGHTIYPDITPTIDGVISRQVLSDGVVGEDGCIVDENTMMSDSQPVISTPMPYSQPFPHSTPMSDSPIIQGPIMESPVTPAPSMQQPLMQRTPSMQAPSGQSPSGQSPGIPGQQIGYRMPESGSTPISRTTGSSDQNTPFIGASWRSDSSTPAPGGGTPIRLGSNPRPGTTPTTDSTDRSSATASPTQSKPAASAVSPFSWIR